MNKSTKSTIALAVSLLLSGATTMPFFGTNNFRYGLQQLAQHSYWAGTFAPTVNASPQYKKEFEANRIKGIPAIVTYGMAIPTASHLFSKGLMSSLFRNTAPNMVGPYARLPFALVNLGIGFGLQAWADKKLATFLNPKAAFEKGKKTFQNTKRQIFG